MENYRISSFLCNRKPLKVALAISTASGASFFQLAPTALGVPEKQMTQPFVIVPATVMCLVFWYCLTIDKIKDFLKIKAEKKRQKRSSRLSMISAQDIG